MVKWKRELHSPNFGNVQKFVNKDITQFKTIFRPFGMRIF